MGSAEKTTHLRQLTLLRLLKLKQIWSRDPPVNLGFHNLQSVRVEDCDNLEYLFPFSIAMHAIQIDPILEDLEYLLVQHCSNLKQLVPSTVTCSQLTYLEVQNCDGLIYLITSSTAKSMVNLKTMIIRNCNSLEQVVAEDSEESIDAIAFRSLCVLELECLPRLKMFCASSYCLLKLPWLYEVVISNCPRMEIFSLGKTEAPMLEKVLTQKEDEKEQWQGDLNTTVTKIFQDMAHQVVETTKQEIPNLPSSSDDRQQKENASSTDPQDAEESHDPSTGTQEMYDTIKKSSISVVQNVPSYNYTMILDTATMYPSPLQAPELATGQITEKSRDSNIDTQNMYDIIKKHLSSTVQNAPNSTMILEVGLAKGTQEMGENIEKPMVEAAKIALSPTGVCSTEIHDTIQTDKDMESIASTRKKEESHGSSTGIQEMCDTMKKPSISVAQNVPTSSSNMIPHAATMYPSPSQAPELATAQITEGSHESETCPRENLFNQPKILATCDNNEAVGSQEIRESDQHAQKLATTENKVTGTQERHETIDKMPLVQPSQKHIESYHDLEKESHESKTCPNEDWFNQPETFVIRDNKENIHDNMDKPLIQTDQDAEKLATIQNTEESRDSYTGTPKICNTMKEASISASQDVSNSTMIPGTAIDPSLSQAPEPAISPTEKLNIYRNYKEMIDISKQNMPYLEAGVNRHPQVLDWLDTKRRRVFASSTFSLFAEVTCILRTTRKGHLTEDDRSYIRECCTILEAAGFDVSWLSYVHKCIEECGDAEDMKRKVEETKGQASSLEAQIESMKKELASVKESLVLLLDKARNLDDFIES
ncbi:hypothetical protein QN277_023342 [Acacia crassicarpa]|uniref:Disease resistance protein At4g27190-like leucine-rich repeats domain-containing protein n=1 Tax=Acacia crassicarpa TaxID=499986 RepID=A0AAE1JIP1_9FABA|nr:hypothetical protein QN277_023342 [Acacia crassicarpa]